MPAQPPKDRGLETDGVLVRPIGGQIYLVEENDDGQRLPWEEPPAPDRSPLSGLISRH